MIGLGQGWGTQEMVGGDRREVPLVRSGFGRSRSANKSLVRTDGEVWVLSERLSTAAQLIVSQLSHHVSSRVKPEDRVV